jgi:Tfp pilus assembly protein PilN
VEVTLLSWNVAGRVRRLREQAERVIGLGAGAVCLQEVSGTSARVWMEAQPLTIEGLPWSERALSTCAQGLESSTFTRRSVPLRSWQG